MAWIRNILIDAVYNTVMGKKVAYCGIDCTTCEEHQVTVDGAPADREALLGYWRHEYPDATMDFVTCHGCREHGTRLFFLCNKCKIRQCAMEKKVGTCACCDEYPCNKLENHLALFPEARKNLEDIRRSGGDGMPLSE